ncbi:MAG: hypothetical protein IPL01_24725 [Acidobacteria bacterium]|nr:hypothetical protein [Acidobacteriota bacterium]
MIGYEGVEDAPKGKLKEDEIADIGEWVRMGLLVAGAAPVTAVSETGKWAESKHCQGEFTEQEKSTGLFSH